MVRKTGEQLVNMDASSANPGFIRPPFIFFLSILTGFITDSIWPVQIGAGEVVIPIGILFLALGMTVFGLSQREFKRAKTPIPGNKPTTSIICTGPFSFSRNPIYLAFSIIQLSVALLSQTLWVLVMIIPALVLIQCVVIPREERHLENLFNSTYTDYKSSVRQWL